MKNIPMSTIVWVVCNATLWDNKIHLVRSTAREALADHKEGCRLNGEAVQWTHIERCLLKKAEGK